MSNMKNKAVVLIIDDTPRNLQLVGNLLGEQGYKPVFATDGERGLSSAIANPPDLVLLDISMPGMDGFEVCEKLNNNVITKDIPVIFLTARADMTDVLKGFKIGAVDYVTKPFNNAELLQRVFTHVDLKQSKDIIRNQNDDLQIKNTALDKMNQIIADSANDMKRMNEQLEVLNDSKDKLFSIIAHDLRGPVGGIKTMLELINNPAAFGQDELTEEVFEALLQAANRTWYLLENLLAWSRTERGILNVKKQNVAIESVVADVIALLKSSGHEKKIQMVNEIPKELRIKGDENMIATIIRNYISNALKFTPKGGTIKVHSTTEGVNVKVIVTDNGIGMGDEIRTQIFVKGSYLSTHGTNNEKGSGLGLKISKEFVELQDGIIGVDSQEGKGSSFWFSLPK